LYREYGEAGLLPKGRSKLAQRLSESVQEKIVEIKMAHPQSGSRRISDVLRRFFLIKASASSVHKTLSQEGLTTPAKRKPKRNPAKPRFFERSRPNQLWQGDIMTFRLAGRNAYLIGFMDDYSRYITGLGFYRSQTAAQVLETYRRALSEYGVPKEVLTDNGRQYTNWRGTTRFERELKKDRVRHIKSRPHHPMTLGKIERFWKTIQNEYLQRAQFTSFEDAVERTAFWIKYYNYKRPHQGIGGLCPADRFFEIQHALKRPYSRVLLKTRLN
jgi:transposase InsO family protein